MRAILTLHAIEAEGDVLTLRPEAFESLLDGLAAAGHRVVPLTELLARPGVPDQVAVTFDDGLASVAEEALPILARRGLVATVFVVTDHVGSDNDWPGQPASIVRRPTMGWGELEALAEAGWGIGSHTRTHPDLRGASAQQLADEIGGAADAIRTRLGRDPVGFAWPGGAVDAAARTCARRHHRWALGTRLARLDAAVDDPFDLPRVDTWYLRHRQLHPLLGTAAADAWIGARARIRAWRAR